MAPIDRAWRGNDEPLAKRHHWLSRRPGTVRNRVRVVLASAVVEQLDGQPLDQRQAKPAAQQSALGQGRRHDRVARRDGQRCFLPRREAGQQHAESVALVVEHRALARGERHAGLAPRAGECVGLPLAGGRVELGQRAAARDAWQDVGNAVAAVGQRVGNQ